jgi:acyl-CoA-binding protein
VARVRAANTDNATLLNLYALFKQATVGVNDTPKPSMLDFVVRELNELARTDDWLRVLAAHTAPPA